MTHRYRDIEVGVGGTVTGTASFLKLAKLVHIVLFTERAEYSAIENDSWLYGILGIMFESG